MIENYKSTKGYNIQSIIITCTFLSNNHVVDPYYITRKYVEGDTDQFNLDVDNKVTFKLGNNQLKSGVPNPIRINPSVLVRT